jgi:hypothetical protein
MKLVERDRIHRRRQLRKSELNVDKEEGNVNQETVVGGCLVAFTSALWGLLFHRIRVLDQNGPSSMQRISINKCGSLTRVQYVAYVV